MSPPRITETEWEIMKVLWHRSPLTSQEVFERLSRNEKWHPKTVRSLMNRLVKKQALITEREGRAYLYSPVVKESDCLTARSNAFLASAFGGSLTPMVKHFVDHKRLSAKEIRELKQILEGKR